MIKETFRINDKDKYRLDVYIQDESDEITLSHMRPFVLVCPGGGYAMTSDREADPIALAYMADGFNTGVLRYSVGEDAAWPAPNVDLSNAIRIIRENASRWHTDPNKIAVCGFSAGGHLTAMQGVHWNDPEIMRMSSCNNGENCPDAIILGYPVITSDEKTHGDSIKMVLRKVIESGDIKEIERMTEYVSAEKNIGSHTPPVFLFHTCHDQLVPVYNSLVFAAGLERNGIDFEMHIFEKGEHGLAMCNHTTHLEGATFVNPDAEKWIKMSCRWLWKHFS